MNILLIHQYFLEKNDGGGSRFNEMVKHWSDLGYEVTVLSGMVHYATGKKPEKYKGKYFYKDLDFYKNTDVIRCHVSDSYNVNFIGRLWAYFSFVFSGIWAGLFKTRKAYDVILVTSPPLFVGIIAYVLSKLKLKPFVFEIRDLWPESAIDTGVLTNKWIIKFAYWFEAFIYKRAEKINVLTPAFRKKLIEEKNIDTDKIAFIPNAADFSLAESLLSDFDAPAFKTNTGLEDKFIITYVGAHGVANHLIQLVDAAEHLKETNVVFQLIGDGMKKQDLIVEVKKRNLQDQFIFRDSVPKSEVFKYILASDMGASVLKKVDTFKTIYSNKTFDYMSCKKPVLLLIDGVSRELVQEAKCGVYLEPENTLVIAKGIKEILKYDKSQLDQMGENGYQYAKKHFDRQVLAKRYLDVLKNALIS
ncbi:glycosyltransferase family 4 protein [Psychroflexus sp. YR1-1]|uniref:Glycosyltransferase family 4 protein n=1 Tax=Psychroflexus aurantiacus TaxID=2709310 RepID=A0A6B3R5Q1_9FLAO|nr:glycosyltransferase family 4 protein [Psychroflexus aurantiacus]NEV92724.1 glycosyltransferase family 4 protein [Psychroflexus aurantiacus]